MFSLDDFRSLVNLCFLAVVTMSDDIHPFLRKGVTEKESFQSQSIEFGGEQILKITHA